MVFILNVSDLEKTEADFKGHGWMDGSHISVHRLVQSSS